MKKNLMWLIDLICIVLVLHYYYCAFDFISCIYFNWNIDLDSYDCISNVIYHLKPSTAMAHHTGPLADVAGNGTEWKEGERGNFCNGRELNGTGEDGNEERGVGVG